MTNLLDNPPVDPPVSETLSTDDTPPPPATTLKERLFGHTSLRSKLITPYVILSLLLALIGIYIVSRLVSGSLHERLVNQLREANQVAADGIVRYERNNLDNLRIMVFTQGVSQAFEDRDPETLESLLLPQMLANHVDMAAAVDVHGVEIRGWGLDISGDFYLQTESHDFSTNPLVAQVLAQQNDAIGDKYAAIIPTNIGLVLATSAPVQDEQGKLVGVLLTGVELERMLADIKTQALAEVILVDPQGNLIGTSLTSTQALYTQLEEAGRLALGMELPTLQDVDLNDRPYLARFNTLMLRQQPIGLLGVALPSNYVASAEATSRSTFSIVFTLGTAGTIIIGYLLAQNIARPILQLRSLSQSVASGDLNQAAELERADEIGDLANAFDKMTENLRQRTAEAERLYAETVQRNIELAATNTRLRETQLQLIQSGKLAAIGQLTAGIVHDVKNPLTVIKGTAEVLLEDEALTTDMRKALSLIREGAIKANKIVSDLLTFARQAPPQLKPQDLGETVQAALRLTTYLTRQSFIQLQLDLPAQPVIAVYDAQQIEQVFINIISNAVQAMPPRGTLRVRLTQADQMAAVSFQDNGTGISPEILERIFDPFFTTKPEGEGTGLGLSVSYGIVASHKGRIDVSSVVGQGTTFTVLLPVEKSTDAAEDSGNGG